MADHCALCDRAKEPTSDYCSFHNTARINLDNAYSTWKKAYGGNLTKDEYFNRLEKLSETGGAARELIRYLRRKKVVA